ncbi:MAG TPA: HupE/UreJ family protein [Gemmatimonadaceae bacterium]|nr:HupE/UreJ family protein [Gemmatimonadaceae bacterium]
MDGEDARSPMTSSTPACRQSSATRFIRRRPCANPARFRCAPTISARTPRCRPRSFTLGHSITLGLAVTGVVHLPSALIEFPIPVTIENLVFSVKKWRAGGIHYRPVLAGLLGLVHGAGFANYLSALFVSPIALPLFGFNAGIQMGQIVVLTAAALGLAGVDRVIASLRLQTVTWPPLRIRVVAVSMLVVVIAARCGHSAPAASNGARIWCGSAPNRRRGALSLKNSISCDLYSDQVNIVQVPAAGGTPAKSLLFTRGDGATSVF